jgi:hypothetical protein
MEFETLTVKDSRYPCKLLDRMGAEAPTLYFHGPLTLLDRFTMSVIAGVHTPAQAVLAITKPLRTIEQYAMNYIGPWHSVWETELMRMAIRRSNDPEGRRSLTICTARGLARETWDNFLGDRFGYEGPFTYFIEKRRVLSLRSRRGVAVALGHTARPEASGETIDPTAQLGGLRVVRRRLLHLLRKGHEEF